MAEQSPTTATTSNDKEQRAAPSRGKARKVAGWLTGWTPTKMAVNEIAGNVRMMGWLFKLLKQAWEARKREVAEQKEIAKVNPETLWADSIRDTAITEKSLRSAYALTYWTDLVILGILALSLGVLTITFGPNKIFITNAVFVNLILIGHVTHLHRLYIAREQRCITVMELIRKMIRSPKYFLPLPLPDNYRLREASPPPPAAESTEA